ncbi:hypothetical protein MWU50_09855 [Flavobacteriaceae bacterium S0862]|jgi:hypothetical protein|nr:hypothetical protein [Flavobacteriaceae bacterium S0862]
MKKQLLLFFIGILAMSTYSQSPEKFSYQAIIRDAGDAIVANTGIGMQISILKGSAGGTAVYVETHSPTTNANGLVTLEIGGGSVVSGTFADIDWSNDSYFIKTETDPSGGTSYTITGTSQLLSVPYALHAKTTDTPITKVFIDQVSRDVTENPWVLGPTFETVSGFKAGSLVKLTYNVPSRTNANVGAWGGLYIEPQISFDGGASWESLGSSGFDGNIMVRQSESIGTYNNTLLIDPNKTTSFTVKIRFYFRSYQQPTTINGNHDINNISGTAPLVSGDNGTQHYTKVIVEEVFQ